MGLDASQAPSTQTVKSLGTSSGTSSAAGSVDMGNFSLPAALTNEIVVVEAYYSGVGTGEIWLGNSAASKDYLVAGAQTLGYGTAHMMRTQNGNNGVIFTTYYGTSGGFNNVQNCFDFSAVEQIFLTVNKAAATAGYWRWNAYLVKVS
jgi:hypothetical protein